MYQTVSEPPPPPPPPLVVFSLTRVLTRGLSKVCSVFQKWDTGKYTYNFKELLTCHRVSDRRELVNTMKSDFGLLVDKGARPHSSYTSATCW